MKKSSVWDHVDHRKQRTFLSIAHCVNDGFLDITEPPAPSQPHTQYCRGWVANNSPPSSPGCNCAETWAAILCSAFGPTLLLGWRTVTHQLKPEHVSTREQERSRRTFSLWDTESKISRIPSWDKFSTRSVSRGFCKTKTTVQFSDTETETLKMSHVCFWDVHTSDPKTEVWTNEPPEFPFTGFGECD